MIDYKLNKGDKSNNGTVEIMDQDRLCYIVKNINSSKGSFGLRTISKDLVKEFVEYIAEHPNATGQMAKEALSGHSDIDKFEYGYNATLVTLANMALKRATKNVLSTGKVRRTDLPLQQIVYGAPGTGKSHSINEATAGEDVIRTTFHPDTDYSTFVGAYKPTTKSIPVTTVIGTQSVPVKDADGKEMFEDKIVYEFVPQAFLQAYVEAWRKYAEAVDGEARKQYLVIEEINRGNCAQIFGDLFQLLDRGECGFSEYPIKADEDMKRQLQRCFSGLYIDRCDEINSLYNGRDVVSEVLQGDILLLPNNLYIWATMNTSDQSLFPIDSAFKRRWDWRYVPIGDAAKGWRIEANGSRYGWWQFVERINAKIGSTTNSEDKKLGYFFCKATEGVISAETFVGKVVFYLWNDVFKDYEFADSIFDDEEGRKLTFDRFYQASGKVAEETVALFLRNLGVTQISDFSKDEEEDDESLSSTKKLSVTFDDGTIIEEDSQFDSYLEAIKKIGAERIYPVAARLKYQRKGCALVDNEQRSAILNSNFTYVRVDGYYVIKGLMLKTMIQALNHWAQELHINVEVEEK